MKRSLVFVFFVAIIVIVGCQLYKKSAPLKFSGILEMTEHVLGTKMTARIANVFVAEGQFVKKGDILVVFDRYEQAKKDYDRLLSLYLTGGIKQQDIEYARLAVEDQKIISPVDGVVLIKAGELGEIIPAGAGVIVIGDTSDLWVKIFVPEGIINHLKVGQSASVYFDGVKDAAQAKIRYIAPKAEFTPRNVQTPEERITQAFAVKVELIDNLNIAHPGVAADVVFDG